jgi:mono/diheme cytochrome c family protein
MFAHSLLDKQRAIIVFVLIGALFIMGVALTFDEPQHLFAQDGPAATDEPDDGGDPQATEEPTADGEGTTLPNPNSDDPVERGEYLVMVAGACQDCHTNDDAVFSSPLDVELSGGQLFEFEPWGMVTTPNLTTLQDWSDEEIENAVRYGVRPDGTTLLPPMPYAAYATMWDEDMADIIAYLRSLEPVENEIAEPIIEDGTRDDVRTVPEIDPDAEFPSLDFEDPSGYGQYLATTVSACVRCHGGVDENGQLDPNAPPAGEVTLYSNFGEFNAPSLMSDNLGEWSNEDIRNVIVNGFNPEGEPIFLMPSHIFTNMTAADIDSIIAWVRSLP